MRRQIKRGRKVGQAGIKSHNHARWVQQHTYTTGRGKPTSFGVGSEIWDLIFMSIVDGIVLWLILAENIPFNRLPLSESNVTIAAAITFGLLVFLFKDGIDDEHRNERRKARMTQKERHELEKKESGSIELALIALLWGGLRRFLYMMGYILVDVPIRIPPLAVWNFSIPLLFLIVGRLLMEAPSFSGGPRLPGQKEFKAQPWEIWLTLGAGAALLVVLVNYNT